MPNKVNNAYRQFKDFVAEEAYKNINLDKLEEFYKQLGVEDFDKFLERDTKAELVRNIIENNGYVSMDHAQFDSEGNKKIMFKDLVGMPDFSSVFPTTVTKMVIEATEPSVTLTPMLEQVPFKGISTRLPAITGDAWNFDIAEGDEPPELTAKLGAWKQVTMGKSGVAVQLTDEAQKYSNYPVMNFLITEAGKALKRWKEYKVAQMLNSTSNNTVTSGSGLDASGSDNDSLTFDDLVDAMVAIINNGANPNLIIMHPLAFSIFLRNPSLRAFFLLTGGRQGDVINWQGPQFQKTFEQLGTWEQKPAQGQQVSKINFPSGIFGRPMSIVLSNYMSFNTSTDATEIIVADSEELGYLMVDELPTAEKMRDGKHGIDRFQIIERYTVTPKNDYKGVELMSGIKAVKGYDPIATLDLSSA